LWFPAIGFRASSLSNNPAFAAIHLAPIGDAHLTRHKLRIDLP